MSKIKFGGVFALLLALACVRAPAMAPSLPPDSVAADTMVVFQFDAVHLNPDALRAAAKAVLGANAAIADDAIAKFKEKFDKAVAAGVETVTFVGTPPNFIGMEVAPAIGAPAQRSDQAAFYVKAKAGSDLKAIEKLIADEAALFDKDKMAVEAIGQYVVLHEKDNPLPAKFDPARARAFADALATVGQSSFRLAMMFDAQTKKQFLDADMQHAPKRMQDAAPLIASCKWITLAVNLGDAPGITYTANAADAESATKLADILNASLDDLKQQMANAGPNAGPMGMLGPQAGQIIDGLRPVTDGARISVGLKGPALNAIATMYVGMIGRMGRPVVAPPPAPAN